MHKLSNEIYKESPSSSKQPLVLSPKASKLKQRPLSFRRRVNSKDRGDSESPQRNSSTYSMNEPTGVVFDLFLCFSHILFINYKFTKYIQ